jgi:DNA-directed RNA polymerase specialized sigma54-like protein
MSNLAERLNLMKLEIEELKQEIYEKVCRHDALEIAITELEPLVGKFLRPTSEDVSSTVLEQDRKQRNYTKLTKYLKAHGPTDFRTLIRECPMNRKDFKEACEVLGIAKAEGKWRLNSAA